jgi:hypothetical protein
MKKNSIENGEEGIVTGVQILLMLVLMLFSVIVLRSVGSALLILITKQIYYLMFY